MKKLNLVKIGGKVLDDPKALDDFLTAFSKLKGPKILVHGGGVKASQLAEKLDIPVQMLEGRRVTPAPMLEVTTMVYAGWINNHLVGQLKAQHKQVAGVNGASLGLLETAKRTGHRTDYGFVGDVQEVQDLEIKKLLETGYLLVFSAITADASGQLLNTNADTLATELAIAMQAHYQVQLQLCFEQEGVLQEEKVLKSLTTAEYQQLKEEKLVYGGMIPKLDNAFRAIEAGISFVKIGPYYDFAKGTVLQKEKSARHEKHHAPEVRLLMDLVSTPSFSRAEEATADIMQSFLEEEGVKTERHGNNVWAKNKYYNPKKPTVLLCSHHDTVKVVDGWTFPALEATLEDQKIYGLGSNDAGASLVALAFCFLAFYKSKNLPFNLLYAAVAEEEVSGANGVSSILDKIGNIEFGIIGEPTQMEMAVAERGLMVLDGLVRGEAGHAAHKTGVNAISLATEVIQQIQNLQFSKASETLGAVNVVLTQINAGYQHNIIPDKCEFVVDVRSNGCYSNEQLFKIINQQVNAELKARSFRLQSSSIGLDHPIVKAGKALSLPIFGSNTLSDQALLPFPTIKIGPGDTTRSHTANEYIAIEELQSGIEIYQALLHQLKLSL